MQSVVLKSDVTHASYVHYPETPDLGSCKPQTLLFFKEKTSVKIGVSKKICNYLPQINHRKYKGLVLREGIKKQFEDGAVF